MGTIIKLWLWEESIQREAMEDMGKALPLEARSHIWAKNLRKQLGGVGLERDI